MREFFGFFRYGVLPGVYHLLFLLTLPIALMLIWGNEVFIGAIFFIFGAPLFRGLRERSINKKEIRIQKRFEKIANKEAERITELNEEHPIQVLVYPYISELTEHMDENGELLGEAAEKWVWLFFDKDTNFKQWRFSPTINSIIETGLFFIPYHDIANMWGKHISEQYRNTGELNLHTLPNSLITEKHFYVMGPDKIFQRVGGYEEE
jgi:hypothetical protein